MVCYKLYLLYFKLVKRLNKGKLKLKKIFTAGTKKNYNYNLNIFLLFVELITNIL